LRNLCVKISIVMERSTYNSIRNKLSEFNSIVTVDMPIDKLKIIYTRDQSLTWLNNPIMYNMALPIRRGEEEVINEVYYKLGLTPLFKPRWALLGSVLVKAN